MKKYVLVIIWPDGDELTATQPTTKRRKLQKCAASLNSSWTDGTRAEIRETQTNNHLFIQHRKN